MTDTILIYGANGYTGKLVCEEAIKQNISIHIVGRNKEAIEELAKEWKVAHSIVGLENQQELDSLLTTYKTVIHCAGPFTETAEPMVQSCIRTKTNYIDITGEIWAFEIVMKYHQQAEEAGIQMISGAGFDVVPTDCLAAYLKEAVPTATHLEMAFVGNKTSLSRGTAVTMAKNISKGGFIREDGKLKNVPLAYKSKEIEFPHRKQWTMTIPWGDLMTAYHQTNIPNIEIYSGASKKMIKKLRRFRWLKFLLSISWIQKIVRSKIEKSVKGPTSDQLSEGNTYIVGRAWDQENNSAELKMITPEAYHLTAKTALSAAIKLNRKENDKKGYLTPAQAFGKEFILEFEGVELIGHKKTPVNQTGVNYQP